MTVVGSPLTRSTRSAPTPWSAYAPALSSASPVETYQSSSSRRRRRSSRWPLDDGRHLSVDAVDAHPVTTSWERPTSRRSIAAAASGWCGLPSASSSRTTSVSAATTIRPGNSVATPPPCRRRDGAPCRRDRSPSRAVSSTSAVTRRTRPRGVRESPPVGSIPRRARTGRPEPGSLIGAGRLRVGLNGSPTRHQLLDPEVGHRRRRGRRASVRQGDPRSGLEWLRTIRSAPSTGRASGSTRSRSRSRSARVADLSGCLSDGGSDRIPLEVPGEVLAER